jgi:hypothetical protein
MDNTQHPGVSPTEDGDDALDGLAEADPADAPDIAERIAADLTERLDGPEDDDSTEQGSAR